MRVVNYMKDISIVLGVVMRAKGPAHCFTPLRRSPSDSKLLLWKKVRDSTREDFQESDAKNEENESVDLRPVFQIKNSALKYISVFPNSQRRIAVKLAALTIVVVMVIRFPRSAISLGEVFGQKDYRGHERTSTIHP